MAFAFGTQTSNLGFGAAAKPAFGSNFSFGSNTAASTATTGFGGFGTAATAAPAFGATTSTTSTGFGGFGTQPATGTTGFGGFGTTPASTAPSIFGGTSAFGSSAQKPAFPATTGTGIGFGTGTTGFGTGTTGFGTSAPAFGTTAPAFGTGTSAFGTGTTGFGTGTSGFGTGTNTFGTGTSAFGGGTSTFGSSFGTGSSFGGFGVKPATTNAFGGFGTGLGTSAFGQPQQQQAQQQQVGPQNANDALLAAVFNCSVFGDERDQVLAKWNFLQAKWGTGQAYYSAQAPPLELTQANPLCRFKAIGYSLLPSRDDRAGLVLLIFGKTEQEIKSQQAQLITMMTTILGNKPNLTVNVDSIQAISENKAQAVIFVLDKSNGSRILASELSAHLQSVGPKQQLTTAGCLSVLPLLAPEPAPLRQYLEIPPAGIDIRLWKQAQADNPNPAKYIPIPMVGFAELKWRAQCRGEEAERHAAWLARCSAELRGLRARHAAAAASAAALRRRLATLQHCLLQVIVRQETSRRVGAALTPQEEALRARLDALHTQLAAPTLFNGRLSELLSQMRMQRCQSAIPSSERCQMDPGAQDDIKQFLSMQQKGMAHLMETAQKDLAHLRVIQEGMTRLLHGNVDG